MIFALPISMLFLYIIFKITGFDGFSDGAALAFLGVFLVLYFIGTWLGAKLHDFTKYKFACTRFGDHAKLLADLTEIAATFAVLLLFFGIVLLMAHITDGSPPPEKINGWD